MSDRVHYGSRTGVQRGEGTHKSHMQNTDVDESVYRSLQGRGIAQSRIKQQGAARLPRQRGGTFGQMHQEAGKIKSACAEICWSYGVKRMGRQQFLVLQMLRENCACRSLPRCGTSELGRTTDTNRETDMPKSHQHQPFKQHVYAFALAISCNKRPGKLE